MLKQRCLWTAVRSALDQEQSTEDQSQASKFGIRPGKYRQNSGAGCCKLGGTEPPFHLWDLKYTLVSKKKNMGKIPIMVEMQVSNSSLYLVSSLKKSEKKVAIVK